MASTTTLDAGITPAPPGGKTFFGHPRGLATLFMTETWERFSFYGMRALLVIYMVADHKHGGLGMPVATATAVYSVYNAMVYLLALPGGWIADRFLGARKTVALGGAIIMIGHFLLAVPVEASFFVGLVFIAVGSGLLKANISTMVGHLYEGPNDPRRDGGFTIFYMGINLGAFAAPLVIGTVGQSVDWHLGFALAGIGMALGLSQYLFGTRHLSPKSSVVSSPISAAEKSTILRKGAFWLALAAVFYGVVVLSGTFTINWAVWPLSIAGIAIPIVVFARIKRDKDLSADDHSKIRGYIWFFVVAAVFWMIYDQSGSTLSVFADSSTNLSILGWKFPSSWFQSLNPLYIMALAPVFAWLWVWLARRMKNPSTTMKFAIGLLMIGASFLVMMLAMAAASGGVKVSPLWLALVYLVQTVGELTLSPVGLSVTTKLAPAKYASQMMGIWFLAVTAGDCVAAIIQLGLGNATGSTWYFAIQGAAAIVAGVALVMYRKNVIKLMGNVH
ncbi:POT family proton-dependent oligopeptide transporter [Kitasatospora sp. MAP12-15]|uniref:peptide MFS transporter n=1 Tax=unclassified Kitasatospora TaxID=2633591 RepID=UPI002476FE0A|nr:oligopeptide:H+ symporter [Kitasatospora sp. MAP12-44]MDH6110824.1 POT family proton-dependent oligopeptide transporter [Kitasatospora sp. MAP12-44]